MANEKEVKDAKATEWSNRYRSFGNEDSKAVGLETKAAAEIITHGVSVKNVKFVKALDWIIFADLLVISIICMAGVYKVDDNLLKTGKMIAILGTLWPIFDVVSTACRIYSEYSINISPAVHIFMNSTSAGNAYRNGYTKQMIVYTPKEADEKIKELKKKLRFDISKSIFVLLIIFSMVGFFLGGYLLYWDTKKAGLFALIGIGFGLLVTVGQHIFNVIKK